MIDTQQSKYCKKKNKQTKYTIYSEIFIPTCLIVHCKQNSGRCHGFPDTQFKLSKIKYLGLSRIYLLSRKIIYTLNIREVYKNIKLVKNVTSIVYRY